MVDDASHSGHLRMQTWTHLSPDANLDASTTLLLLFSKIQDSTTKSDATDKGSLKWVLKLD